MQKTGSELTTMTTHDPYLFKQNRYVKYIFFNNKEEEKDIVDELDETLLGLKDPSNLVSFYVRVQALGSTGVSKWKVVLPGPEVMDSSPIVPKNSTRVLSEFEWVSKCIQKPSSKGWKHFICTKAVVFFPEQIHDIVVTWFESRRNKDHIKGM